MARCSQIILVGLIFMIALIASVGSVYADDDSPPSGAQAAGPPKHDKFAIYDTNHDGKYSQEEVQVFLAPRLGSMFPGAKIPGAAGAGADASGDDDDDDHQSSSSSSSITEEEEKEDTATSSAQSLPSSNKEDSLPPTSSYVTGTQAPNSSPSPSPSSSSSSALKVSVIVVAVASTFAGFFSF